MVSDPGDLFVPGSRVGRYRLLARLGSGGMAEVFLGNVDGPSRFSKFVAIKRMRPELTTSSEFVNLFLEEARTASMLSHPNICQIYELARVDDEYLLVMEYLEGVPLSTVMLAAFRDPTPYDIRFIIGILLQSCAGMHYAHELRDENGKPYGIVHRDVSPPNLFVTTNGLVKVLDFGIAKSSNSIVRTMTGQIRGKFSYMSPEQLRGHKLDRRSDVFALGIVLYEMLAARRLFRRTNRLNIFHAIVRDPLPPIQSFRSDLTQEMVAIVQRALARDREERYGSANDLATDLARASMAYGGALPPAGIAPIIMQQFGPEIAAKHELCSVGSDRSAPIPSETALPLLPHDAATITEVMQGPPPGPPADWVDTEATTQMGNVTRDTQVDRKRS